MRIVIDPTSLQRTASVLRSAADALGEVCSRVAGAVDGVYAPPSVAAYADSVTASAASAIHNVIYELLDDAADLERRAACCCADQSTSLPVPALVGMAFGGAAIGTSAIGTAASGPGVSAPTGTSVAGAYGSMSIYEALGTTTLGGTSSVGAVSTSLPGMSIYEALGNASLGATSPVGTGISMVYDPTYNPSSMTPGVGTGVSMVYDPSGVHPVAAGVSSSIPLPGSRLDATLTDLAIRPLTSQIWGQIGTNIGATYGPLEMG
jgi:hypothetical protein